MANAIHAFASRRALSTFAIGAAAAILPATLASGGNGAGAQWLMGGADLSNSRNQTNTSITPANVGSLALQWRFQTGGDVSATPLVVYSPQRGVNIVYFPDFAGNFYAVNGTTGQLIWTRKVAGWTGVTGDYARDDPVYYAGNNGNGVGGHAEIIIGDQAGALAQLTNGALQGPGAWVIAFDPDTGALIWKTQVEKFPGAVVTSSPVIYNGTVYVGVAGLEEGLAANPDYPCCTSRGSVVALDAKKGARLWQTYMVPNNNGLPGAYSGGAVWGSTPVLDASRNSVFVGTGNNYSVPQKVKACNLANPKNPACTDPTDYFDSIVALDMGTGKVKWVDRAMFYDTWNVACLSSAPGAGNCPDPAGPDYDFGGAGPNLMTTASGRQLIGAGEKSGYYYAVDPDTGAIAWRTLVGPGSPLGGVEWGTAFDSASVYVPIANYLGQPYATQPLGPNVNGGSWAALDPATGAFKWQTATPGACVSALEAPMNCMALGPASAAGGVVFGGTMDKDPTKPTMFALNGANGAILWSFVAGGTVNAGPAIVGNWVYWGSGYSHLGIGTANTYLYAFAVRAR